MSNHLTEDQISRWFAGQSSAGEQRHVQNCGSCTAELGHFLETLESFRGALGARVDVLTQHKALGLGMLMTGQSLTSGPGAPALLQLIQPPSLIVSLKRAVADWLHPVSVPTSASPIAVKDIWSKGDFRHARWLSLAVHAVVLVLLLIPPVTSSLLPSTQTIVTVYTRSVPLILNSPRMEHAKSGGGGGGGRKTLTPPSKGVLPRGADKQIVPPMLEAKNLTPELVVEPTIIAPQLSHLRPLDLQIGDPNGVAGPLSAGPGRGGGVGIGDGTGVGPGRGPGAGDGRDGGIGGDIYNLGGGVSEPVVVSRVQPEYSDDARKARVQVAVELLIIVMPDGTARLDRVIHSLGYGLDQRAIDAVTRWKFSPGKKSGVPVATRVAVTVNFSLR